MSMTNAAEQALLDLLFLNDPRLRRMSEQIALMGRLRREARRRR